MPTGPASRLMPKLRRVVLARAVSERTDGQLLGAFVANRDADAFAGLVRRHGPMVLGVCRRVTGDHTTADDAFQAVFLVLARRAAAIKPREQVGNWLYGVAYRTAIKARVVLARRRSREKQVDVMPEPPVTSPPDVWSDLQPVIDEELARLPDKLRIPIVLCDLEGRTQREVAKHLGVPPATLATRLATARRTLAQQLTRRGVTLSGGALAGLLTSHGTVTAVSHSLAYGLAQAAETVAGGGIATSLVSAHAIQLSDGVIRMMLLTKLKTVAVALLTAVALTGGLGLGLVPAAAGDDPAQPQTGKSAVTAAPPASNAPSKQGAEQPFKVVVNELNTIEYQVPLVSNDTLMGVLFCDHGTIHNYRVAVGTGVRVSIPALGPLPLALDFAFPLNHALQDIKQPNLGLVDDATFLKRLILDLCGTPPTDIEMSFFIADQDADKRAKVVVWMTEDEAILAQLAKKLGVPAEKIRLVRVVDARTGKLAKLAIVVAAVEPKIDPVAAAFTPDGKKLVTQTVDEKTGRVSGRVRIWDVETGKEIGSPKKYWQKDTIQAGENNNATPIVGGNQSVWLDFDNDGRTDIFVTNQFTVYGDNTKNSDAEFLKRVLLDARGTPPTSLEERYFSEDKDPKKREKLLDTLLKDPTVAKKLGDEWKKKMLAAPSAAATYNEPFRILPYQQAELNYYGSVNPQAFAIPYRQAELNYYVNPQPPTATIQPATPPVPQPTRLEKLVGELLAAKKSDAEMLEAVTLATVGRLPTDTEKRLTLGLAGKTVDRKAAWVEVAKALATTEEGTKQKVSRTETVPVPPAKP